MSTDISIEEAKEFLRVLAGYRDDEQRWPRVRQGQREPIPWEIRWAVYERDGRRCLSCGRSLAYKEAQLDHITPWSAGGGDDSENLRILCEDCNMDRSNFRGSLDTWNAKRLPVTFMCADCAHLVLTARQLEALGLAPSEDGEPCAVVPEMVPAFCAPCGFTSRTLAGETY